MNEPDKFDELHDAKLTALYRENAQQMPSPAAAAAILAAARRAVGAGPQRRPLLLRQRWLAPLLAAATVAVIAIGIVRMVPPADITSPAAERARAPAPALAASNAARPAPADERPIRLQPLSPRQTDRSLAFVPSPPAAPAPAARVAAKPAPREDRPALEQQQAESRQTGNRSEFVPAPPTSVPELPRSVAAAPPAAIERAPAARYEAPAAAPPPPFATAQSAPPAAAAGGMAARKSLGAAPLQSRDASITRDPATWIKAIRELRNAGRRDEAAHELAEFKRRFPDYELPADLRDDK